MSVKESNSEYLILTIIALIALSITIPSAFGVGLTFGPELTLSDSPGDSTLPQIAVNGSKIYVIWKDVDSTNGDTDVLFKRSTDGGSTFSSTAINITSALTGNVDTDAARDNPLIAFSDTHGFVYVVWEDQDTANGDNDIFFARSADSGATFGTPVNLSQSLTGNPRDPTIATNGTNVYVAWSDDDGGDSEIYFRSSSDGGSTFSPDITNAPTKIWDDGGTEPSQEPRLAASGDNVYIFWQDEAVGTSTNTMYFRASTDKGVNWAPAIGNTPSEIGGSTTTKRTPSIAVSGDKIHLTWRDSGSTKIAYRNVTDSSGTYTFNPALSSPPTTLRTYVGIPTDIQTVASGNFVNIAWSEPIGGADIDVFFMNSTNRGITYSDVEDLSGNAIEASGHDIIVNGTTSFVVWSNVQAGATDSDIVALASFSSKGAKFSGVPSAVTDDTQRATNPDVGTDGTKMFVVWEDETGDVDDPEIRFSVGTASGQDVDFDKTTYRLSDTVTITVTSPASNTNKNSPDEITATATSTSEAGNISIKLTETGNDSNEFSGTMTFSTTSSNDATDVLKALPGNTVSATFSTTTTNVSIFPRTVDIAQATYTLGDTAKITVTDQNSNNNSNSAEKITITITSTKQGSSTTLELTETGTNTGIFGGATDVDLKFSNSIAEIPLNRGLTISQIATAGAGTTDVTVGSETEAGGVTITLEETSNAGTYSDIIQFTTESSSGNSIRTKAGEFVTITKGALTSNAIITPRNDLSKAVLQVLVTGTDPNETKDTITASFEEASDTATIEFTGGESGGGGGGLVRPTVVLNAVAGAAAVFGGGGVDKSPPITTLGDITKSKQIDVPEHIKKIVESQKLSVPIKPLEDEPFDLPLAINEKKYPLGDNENRIETDKLEVGKPVKFKMLFYEQGDLEHVSMYMNLRDGIRSDQSDTYIIFEKRVPMKIVDKNGFFESVNFEIVEGEDNKKFAIFEITFAKPMETSDLVYKTWDFDRRGTAIKVHDAIKVEEPVTEKTTVKQIEETLEEKPPVPKWVKSNAKWWSDGQIDDKTFTNGIGFLISEKIIDVPTGPNVSVIKDDSIEIVEEPIKETNVPQWVKSNAKWWAEDLIDEETFLAGIEYLVKHEIITVI